MSIHEEICEQKTRRGNVYETYDEAYKITISNKYFSFVFTPPYVCPACGKYHVGKDYRNKDRGYNPGFNMRIR